MLQKVVLGLGSNIGIREHNLKRALKMLSLSRNFLFIGVSKTYETEPWGFEKQKDFLNCTAIFLYRSSPDILLNEIEGVERKAGRTMNKKWHPREIDIDVLFYGNKIVKSQKLDIPHPFVHLRNFVLAPLMDLIPDFVHPVLKKSIRSLYRKCPDKRKVVLHKIQIF